jgi:hypothetical protein
MLVGNLDAANLSSSVSFGLVSRKFPTYQLKPSASDGKSEMAAEVVRVKRKLVEAMRHLYKEGCEVSGWTIFSICEFGKIAVVNLDGNTRALSVFCGGDSVPEGADILESQASLVAVHVSFGRSGGWKGRSQEFRTALGKEGFVQKPGLSFDIPGEDLVPEKTRGGRLAVEILVRPDDRILHAREDICLANEAEREAVIDAHQPPQVRETTQNVNSYDNDLEIDTKDWRSARDLDMERSFRDMKLRKRILDNLDGIHGKKK